MSPFGLVFFSCHVVSFHSCQITWVTSVRFAVVAHVVPSDVTEERRLRGYVAANITLQWKLPVSTLC